LIVGPEDERYQRYLCSREWAERRRTVLARCGGVCERCRHAAASHVHHLTYIRKYRERPEDLQALCEPCHEFTHGKRDDDPLKAIPPMLWDQDEM
jgi:5-methylcytosine-specific restriction endonuclease McrA